MDFAGCETKQEKKFDVCHGRFYLANITSVWIEDFDGVFDLARLYIHDFTSGN